MQQYPNEFFSVVHIQFNDSQKKHRISLMTYMTITEWFLRTYKEFHFINGMQNRKI